MRYIIGSVVTVSAFRVAHLQRSPSSGYSSELSIAGSAVTIFCPAAGTVLPAGSGRSDALYEFSVE